MTPPAETWEQKAERYERGLKAISRSTLPEAEFIDYVRLICDDLLAGLEPECAGCGTDIHEGPCVSENGEENDE